MLATLNKTFDEIRKHVHLAKQESGPVLQEATVLVSNKHETERKKQILDAVNAHFFVSDEDLATFKSSAEPVDDRFFAILGRVKQIHKDCELLLGSENQRLGTELMEQTSRNLDAAFKKLYNWVQREFKGLDLEDPHISGAIRRALRVLSERPTLFQNCLDFFAQARQHTLAQAFQVALTDASATSAKAIEFSTHDPLRYVGDMLAWVHSTTVSEKEALEGLFIADEDEISKGMRAGQHYEPWVRLGEENAFNPNAEHISNDDHGFDGRKALSDLISRNLSLLCQSLQSRIELSIRNIGDPVLLYKVINLLSFYDAIFSRQIGPSTVLYTTLSSLSGLATSHFEKLVEEQTDTLISDPRPPPPQNLGPPSYLPPLLQQLVAITQTRGRQLTSQEFEHLFSTLLSLALNTCAETAASIQETQRRDIFKLNYLCAIHSALATIVATSKIDAAHPSLDRVEQEINKVKVSLSETVQLDMLTRSGIGTLLEELQDGRSRGGPVDSSDQQRRAWLLENLDTFAQQLDAWLPFALMNVQDSLKDVAIIVDSSHRIGGGGGSLRQDIVQTAVEEFCAEFDELEQLLDQVTLDVGRESTENQESLEHADGNNEELPVSSLRALYPRTGAEVRALLS